MDSVLMGQEQTFQVWLLLSFVFCLLSFVFCPSLFLTGCVGYRDPHPSSQRCETRRFGTLDGHPED